VEYKEDGMGGKCDTHRGGEWGIRNAYIAGKLERKPLGRLKHIWEDNIRIDFKEVDWVGVDWTRIAWNRDQW
jgi:hypothetical protein